MSLVVVKCVILISYQLVVLGMTQFKMRKHAFCRITSLRKYSQIQSFYSWLCFAQICNGNLAIVRGPLAAMQDDWWEAESLNNLIKYVSGFRQQLFSATELARKKLSGAQHKMEFLYDCQASL